MVGAIDSKLSGAQAGEDGVWEDWLSRPGPGGRVSVQPESTRWGQPVDRLRFAMSNYQRLTMQQIMHLKH